MEQRKIKKNDKMKERNCNLKKKKCRKRCEKPIVHLAKVKGLHFELHHSIITPYQNCRKARLQGA